MVLRKCAVCKKPFPTSPGEIKRGGGVYCRVKCRRIKVQRDNKKRMSIPNTSCAACNKQFYRKPSRKISKTGLNFCNPKCRIKAQGIGKVLEPKHYGTSKDYRTIALRYYKHECVKCGYKKYKDILEVHHKDRDRTNNSIKNLQILCPTCHKTYHYFQQKKELKNGLAQKNKAKSKRQRIGVKKKERKNKITHGKKKGGNNRNLKKGKTKIKKVSGGKKKKC